jgi:hypothetical protein
MSGWVVRMPRESAAGAARLRRLPDVQLLMTGDTIWLKGKRNAEVEQLLAGIPGAARYTSDPEGLLTPIGGRLPVARLPDGDWKPINAWLQLCLPPSKYVTPPLVAAPRLALVRSAVIEEQPPAALLCSFAEWAEYIESAPRMRWDRLRFAASRNAQAFIVGAPLPPISGRRLWESKGIYIESGWHWAPRVEPAIVRQVLHLAADERVLWLGCGETQRFQEADLIVARRSAIRTTKEALGRGR